MRRGTLGLLVRHLNTSKISVARGAPADGWSGYSRIVPAIRPVHRPSGQHNRHKRTLGTDPRMATHAEGDPRAGCRLWLVKAIDRARQMQRVDPLGVRHHAGVLLKYGRPSRLNQSIAAPHAARVKTCPRSRGHGGRPYLCDDPESYGTNRPPASSGWPKC